MHNTCYAYSRVRILLEVCILELEYELVELIQYA
jgi:hypothetical protein